jgi:hypothetical protein
MDFHFYELEDEKEALKINRAMMHVSIDKDYPVLRVDVDLGSIPGVNGTGYEVIVNFQV